MKLIRILCILLTLSFLTSCALQKGVLDEKKEAAETATMKKRGETTITAPEEPAQPAETQADQGNAVASKMIAPLTH